MEYATVNETGAFGIPPYKGNRGQYFAYTLPFYEQSVYKNTVLRDYIGNVKLTHKLIEIVTSTLASKKNVPTKVNLFTLS